MIIWCAIPQKVGAIYTRALVKGSEVHGSQPYLVIREATFEEYIEERIACFPKTTPPNGQTVAASSMKSDPRSTKRDSIFFIFLRNGRDRRAPRAPWLPPLKQWALTLIVSGH